MRWADPERIAAIYAALMVASVGVALAGLTWRLMGYADTPPVAAGPDVAPSHAMTAADLMPIATLAPFGRTDPSAIASTRLPLELRGAVLARPESQSSAWIAASGGTARSYRVGATVSGGAILKSVAGDHVVLNVSGKLERLAFPKDVGLKRVRQPASDTPVGEDRD